MDVTASLAGAPQPPPQTEARPRPADRETVRPVETQQIAAKSVPAETAIQSVEDQQNNKRAERQQEARSNEQKARETSQTEAPAEVRRSFELDENSETFVFKAIDQDDGEIVRQVPEEILLKLRAYNDGKPPGSIDENKGSFPHFERTA